MSRQSCRRQKGVLCVAGPGCCAAMKSMAMHFGTSQRPSGCGCGSARNAITKCILFTQNRSPGCVSRARSQRRNTTGGPKTNSERSSGSATNEQITMHIDFRIRRRIHIRQHKPCFVFSAPNEGLCCIEYLQRLSTDRRDHRRTI